MAIFFANLHISTVHTPKSNLSVVKLWPRQLDKNFELQPTSKSTSKKKYHYSTGLAQSFYITESTWNFEGRSEEQ